LFTDIKLRGDVKNKKAEARVEFFQNLNLFSTSASKLGNDMNGVKIEKGAAIGVS